MSLEQQLQRTIEQKIRTQLNFKLQSLKNRLKKILKDSIKENVYDVYDPVVYSRTYELLNAVDITDVKIYGNEISFSLFLNSDLMNHESIFNPEIEPYVPLLIEEGHVHKKYTTPMFHRYPARKFIEKAIPQIEAELKKYIKDALNIEVKKIPGKPFY